MIVLGIDPGSRVTGYGLVRIQGNHLTHIDSGPIKFRSEQSIGVRMVHLVDELELVIKEHQPQAISLEKVFHAVNVKSTLMLGYMRGAVIYLAERMGIPLFEYAATEVKLAVTGYGRADKAQVQEMVRILLSLNKVPTPHDVSDALANAICHAHSAPPPQQTQRAIRRH